MQRLGATEDCGHGLQRHPHDVIIRLLCRQRAPRRLRMKAQHLRPWGRGLEALTHNPSPQPTRRPEFSDFLQKMVVHIEKKRQLCANSLTSSPTSSAASTYAMPSANVKATSCTAVEPASRM